MTKPMELRAAARETVAAIEQLMREPKAEATALRLVAAYERLKAVIGDGA